MMFTSFCTLQVVSAAFFAVCVCIWHLTASIVPSSYMDELFHVPQAQAYCAGNYSTWNPLITTPPGLYAFSMAVIEPILVFYGTNSVLRSAICSVRGLRLTNALFLMALFFLVEKIVSAQLRKHRKDIDTSHRRVLAVFTALNVALFPVLFFVSFLYYTDTVSCLSVLLMFYASLSSRMSLCAAFGVLATFCRQTNIVWVAYFAGVYGYDTVESFIQQHQKSSGRADNKESKTSDPNKEADVKEFTLVEEKQMLYQLYLITKTDHRVFINLVVQLFVKLLPFLCIVGAFVVFLRLNGGIVLGDQKAHQPCLHFAQQFYCIAFLTAVGFPVVLRHIKPFADSIFRFHFTRLSMVLFLCATAITALLVHFFTVEHLYLLSDNRHYANIIWRRLFRRFSWFRYILSPIYVSAFYIIYVSMQRISPLKRLLYFFCTALVTVPAALVEPRYFIMPYVIWRLSIAANTELISLKQLALECCVHIALNAVTLYLFLYRPFTWSHEEGIQRLMW